MRENLVGRNDLRRQVKNLLFTCLVFVMGMMLLATDAAKGEDSQLTQPEYTDFYNTQYYYNKLKTSVEADPVRNTYNCFDANIDCVKAAMGIGVNFGNELDWNWGMDNDLPTRQRRYTIRISIGYEDAAGEKEYYYYEQPVNAAGNIYTYQNRDNPSQNHAKIKFEKNPSVTMDDSSPINFVKLKVSNSYNKALNKDFTVNVKTLRLYDSNARKLISSDESVLKRHNVRVISSTEWTTVFSKTIDSTVGAFSWNDRILQADIQLENYVSDYTGRPGLIYEHSNNQKLVHKGSGDSATVDTGKLGTLLRVLKSNGVKTIRLPITWYCHMDSTGTIDSEWLAEIKKVVDAMVAEGFYVIINIHHDTGEKGWIKADSNLFNEYQWTYRYLCLQLAQSFKTYGDHLIMQGPNEVLNYKNYKTYATNPGDGTGPITDEEYGVMNQLNNIFVEEIRRAGYNNKNRILLCNTYFSARLNLPKFVMPSDTASNKILVGIHDYTIRTGENNCGLLSSLEWFGNKTSSGGYKYLDPEGEYKYNILMDEFGVYNTESLDKRKALMNTSVPASYQLGIPMIIWDEGGDYAIMKKDGAAWDESTNSDQVAAAMIDNAEDNALPLHDFEEATYTWSSNKKTCTANRKCIRQGCSHAEEERAITSAETTKKATCEEAGEIKYTANFSNEAYGTQETKTPIPAKGHSPESSIIENVVEPTCENDGSHDEVVYCSDCKKELSRDKKTESALGHNWGEPTYTWNVDKSKCTARRVCSRDESHVEEETEEASVKVDEATCENAGETTYTANFSNEAFETQITKTQIPAKGHSPESSIIENVVEPTCENDGSRDEVVYCSVCKKELSRDKKTESALGHNWGEPTYTWNDDKSKCTAKRVCSRDKSHIEEETEKASVKVDEAKCEKAGEITYTANFSNKAFETQITKTDVPAKGHSPGGAKIENNLKPTCENDGSYDEVVYCSVCKKELSRDKKTDNALGHIWHEPTYTWNGDKSKCTAKRVCSRDKSHIEEETEEASVKVDEAKCEKAGETTYTANFSNNAFKPQSVKTNVPAKGHNFGVWFKCDANQHQRICRNNPTHIEKENHMWDEGVITRQPTGNMEGLKEYHCTVCGEVKTEFLPRLPAGTDINQKGSDGTALGEGASEAAAEKAITEMKSDSDPAGSKFNMLQLRSVKQAKTSVTVTWKKVKNAKKYLLYGNACGKKNKMKKIATLSAGKKSYVVKKAAGKKVKKDTYYKFIMVAVDGNGNVLSTSKVIHVASKGGKVGNHKSVTITAKVNAKGKAIKKYKALSKTVIKKGKKITLKCNPVPASKKLKVKKHRGSVYESSNPKVAKVSGKGVVKAIKKGTATIYAYAQNGVFKSVKITVK